jgi:hypothetical protein
MDYIEVLSATMPPNAWAHGNGEIEPFLAINIPHPLALARLNKNRRLG